MTPASDADRHRRLYVGPWRIDLTRRASVASVVSDREIARVAAAALDAGKAPGPASLAIVLTDDAEIGELNVAHMHKRGPTDVLSFPMLPSESFLRPGRSGARRRSDAAVGGSPGRRMHLGDVAISVERAIEQAESGRGGQTGDVRWSAADELRLLVTHGTLHICGWDHAEPDEEAAMRSLEQRLLASGR